MNKSIPEWSAPTKYIVSVGLVIFGLYLVYLSNSVLTLVILAGLFAFLLLPMVDFLEERLKLPRIVAVLITYALVGVALLLSPLVFVNPIIDGFNFLAQVDYQGLVQDWFKWLKDT
jgi:predicted PurR-regulated permease PerM